RRCARAESGNHLSRTAEAAAKRLDHGRVGFIGEQSPREVLLDYQSGPEAASDRDRRLGAHIGDNRSNARGRISCPTNCQFVESTSAAFATGDNLAGCRTTQETR